MKDHEIRKMVKGFVKGLLGTKHTRDKCYTVCYPLSGYLQFCKIDCSLTEGDIVYEGNEWHHYWITLADGRIIDPTADQFQVQSGVLPNLYLELNPGYYQPYTKEIYNNKISEAVIKFNEQTRKRI